MEEQIRENPPVKVHMAFTDEEGIETTYNCVYHDKVYSDEDILVGSVPWLLDHFKKFLLSMGYHPNSINRIVCLEHDEKVMQINLNDQEIVKNPLF